MRRKGTPVFQDGVQLSDVLVLLITALVFFILALISFQSRIITVNDWSYKKKPILKEE
jgi:hypothetical protein